MSHDPEATQKQQLELISQQFPTLNKLAQDEKKIAENDYHTRIDVWNNYITVLDKIENACRYMRGVHLEMNLKSNVQKLADDQFDSNACIALPIGLAATFVTALLLLYLDINSLFAIAAPGVIFGGLSAHHYKQSRMPQIFKIAVKPVLHIDELEYMSHFIKAVPEIKKDPEVYLPEMKLEIPRSVIAQMSLTDVMDQLGRVKLSAGF